MFDERIGAYLDGFTDEEGTMAAGGPEWAKRRDREVNGIPKPDGLYAELKAAAIAAGVHFEGDVVQSRVLNLASSHSPRHGARHDANHARWILGLPRWS